MIRHSKLVQALIPLILFLSGCSFTREPVRVRDDFFVPVAVMPERNRGMVRAAELEQLKDQLQSVTRAAGALRDSLASFQQYTDSLLASARALVDKVSELEAKEFLNATRQKNLERNVAHLQSENKRLSHQLTDLLTRVAAGADGEPIVFAPAPTSASFRNEYADALSLFHQRQYESAIAVLAKLIEAGIEEDLVDNCEYWIGECRFACREYEDGINQFEKVIAISSSNKKADAYYMMGRSYEALKNPTKARWSYEELLKNFPLSDRARAARIKAEKLNRTTPVRQEKKQQKTTA
jgi:TolA-binding protein